MCSVCGAKKAPHFFDSDHMLCDSCQLLWGSHLASQIEILKSEFLLGRLFKVGVGDRIREGLKRRRESGFRLGRPKEIHDITVLSLRSKGFSLNEIANLLGYSKAGIFKALNRQQQDKGGISGGKKDYIRGQQ